MSYQMSKEYLELTIPEKTEFMGKLMIGAQSEEHFSLMQTLINGWEAQGLFESAKPIDLSYAEKSDLDNPVENGPASPQN